MDEGAYTEKLVRQRIFGRYHHEMPSPNDLSVFPNDSWIRPQKSGIGFHATQSVVDIETDMRGIGRPLGRQAVNAKTIRDNGSHFEKSSTHAVQEQTIAPHLQTTHSRLTHSVVGLKGMAPNRLDTLYDPIDVSVIPFERNVNTRLVSKDQWRAPFRFNVQK